MIIQWYDNHSFPIIQLQTSILRLRLNFQPILIWENYLFQVVGKDWFFFLRHVHFYHMSLLLDLSWFFNWFDLLFFHEIHFACDKSLGQLFSFDQAFLFFLRLFSHNVFFSVLCLYYYRFDLIFLDNLFDFLQGKGSFGGAIQLTVLLVNLLFLKYFFVTSNNPIDKFELNL